MTDSPPISTLNANPPPGDTRNRDFLRQNTIYRQELLRTRTAPRGFTHAPAIKMTSHIDNRIGHCLIVVLHYMPDKLVLPPEHFQDYLHHIRSLAEDQFEEFLLLVLDDINNQLVPRWVLLRLTVQDEQGVEVFSLMVEDQQPGWTRPTLINRIVLS